jgi:hypothetical protein
VSRSPGGPTLSSVTFPFVRIAVTSRPLKGVTPTVDLVLGYKKSNKSPILKLLLSRLDELVDRVSKGEKV